MIHRFRFHNLEVSNTQRDEEGKSLTVLGMNGGVVATIPRPRGGALISVKQIKNHPDVKNNQSEGTTVKLVGPQNHRWGSHVFQDDETVPEDICDITVYFQPVYRI